MGCFVDSGFNLLSKSTEEIMVDYVLKKTKKPREGAYGIRYLRVNYICSIMTSPKPEQLTSVALSIIRAKS